MKREKSFSYVLKCNEFLNNFPFLIILSMVTLFPFITLDRNSPRIV